MSMSTTSIAPVDADACTTAPKAAKECWSRIVAIDLVGFSDIAAVAIGALLPAWIYQNFGDVPTNWPMIVQSALIGGFVAHLCLRHYGMYDTERLHDLPQSPARLLAALALAIACVIGISLPIHNLHWHVLVWYSAWLSASFTLILLTRGIAHGLLARFTANGHFDRRIAVFGAGTIAKRVHDHLVDPASGIHFAGVFDDRIGHHRIDPEGLDVAGEIDDLLAAAYARQIDDIVIALPQGADQRISHIVRKLERTPCNVHIVTHLASELIPATRPHSVSKIGPVGLIDVKERPLADWAPLVKRAEDIIVASIGLLISLPLLAIAIVAIKLESSGPAFYRQRRRGLNRAVIEMFKLRTLTVTESDDQVRQVTEGDSRVTRVGRILRRTSIDELPQLWNVLRGEMSVVGPRPHALVHDEQFSTMIEEYANRHQVKPGITGLAQVKGLRGKTETIDQIKDRVEQDMAYVNSWSLWLDLKIIARTLVIVLSGKNAH